MLKLDEIEPGSDMPVVHECGPVTRWVLAMFAGGSGDHIPLHLDIDFVRKAGMKDVFAPGMLSMAYLGQLLLQLAPQQSLRSFSVRFAAITPVNAKVRCFGKVLEKFEEAGETRVRLSLHTRIDDGTVTVRGEAVIAIL